MLHSGGNAPSAEKIRRPKTPIRFKARHLSPRALPVEPVKLRPDATTELEPARRLFQQDRLGPAERVKSPGSMVSSSSRAKKMHDPTRQKSKKLRRASVVDRIDPVADDDLSAIDTEKNETYACGLDSNRVVFLSSIVMSLVRSHGSKTVYALCTIVFVCAS
eukprot:SAG31_NODE_84_length_27014_cov_3.743006_3_plen_162_part_00